MTFECEPDESGGLAERYEIYDVPAVGDCILVATCASKEAIGTTLVTQGEDRWEAEDYSAPVIAIYDTMRRLWVTGPPQEGVA